jgi:hypothetical protein
VNRRGVALGVRLLPGVAPETEWEFLLHESYVGERCGVGLLRSLLSRVGTGSSFGRMVERQLEDEEAHVRTYEEWLGHGAYRGDRYDDALTAYVAGIECVTLELFVIQALLEGFSLGSLEYRAAAATDAYTEERERELLVDELRHVQFAYGHMKTLLKEDGEIPGERFDTVAEDVKNIFAASFAPERIAAFVKRSFDGCSAVSAEAIGGSDGRSRLAWSTLGRVGRHKREFTRRYARAALSIS